MISRQCRRTSFDKTEVLEVAAIRDVTKDDPSLAVPSSSLSRLARRNAA